ncbi:MAG: 50S ribosomal protein L25, partial [Halanaerobiales bacterium]
MEKIKLAAQVREKTGKGVARKLRQSGLVPAVIYGKGKDPQALVVDPQ